MRLILFTIVLVGLKGTGRQARVAVKSGTETFVVTYIPGMSEAAKETYPMRTSPIE